MAVRFMDSANGNDGASRWLGFNINEVLSGQSPSGRSAYRLITNNAQELLYVQQAATPKAGWYGRLSSLNNDNLANSRLLRWLGPTDTIHLSMTVDTNGAIHVRLGGGNGTNLDQSANGLVSTDAWHHYEMWVQIADSGGRAVVWLDGNPTPVIDFTGDTRNGGSDTTAVPRFARPNAGAWDLSDLRISDDNTQLGVTDVWMSLPDGAGNTTGLSQEPGSGANWEKVNEATPDGDTTYVFSDIEGDFDLYTLSDLPSGTWDVLAVQTTFNTKTDDGGSKFVRPVFRSGGSNATGASQSVPASYISRMEVFESNPVTAGAWSQADVNALEVGPEARDS